MNEKTQDPANSDVEDEHEERALSGDLDETKGTGPEATGQQESSETRTPATSQSPQPKSPRWLMEVIVLLVTVASVGVAIAIGVIQYKNTEAERKLSIVQTGSQVSYELSSNFVTLLYKYGSDAQSTTGLTGVLRVKNFLAEPLQNVGIRIWIGIDPDLVKYPFKLGPKGTSIYEGGRPIVEAGEVFEIPFMDRIRQSGFDIEALFNSQKWEQMLQTWGKRLSRKAPTIDLGSMDTGSTPFFNEKNSTVRAIVGRIVVEYTVSGARYSNLLTLIIGTAVKEEGTPWIFLRKL